MDPTQRKRVANFTADEKVLLAQIIKKYSVVECKLTDGKSVAKKKAAWDLITAEFNCQANVHRRDTITLKRAWDNMKAFTRRARAIERGNIIKTGGGPSVPPQPPQQGAIITMVEEAAPTIICEIKNCFDSDGVILNKLELPTEARTSDGTDKNKNNRNDKIEFLDSDSIIIDGNLNVDVPGIYPEPDIELQDNTLVQGVANLSEAPQTTNIATAATQPQAHTHNTATKLFEAPESKNVQKTADYIRREAATRIKYLDVKKKVEMQILKAKLETQETKKRAAELEEQKNKILLDKAKLELEELKNKLYNKT